MFSIRQTLNTPQKKISIWRIFIALSECQFGCEIWNLLPKIRIQNLLNLSLWDLHHNSGRDVTLAQFLAFVNHISHFWCATKVRKYGPKMRENAPKWRIDLSYDVGYAKIAQEFWVLIWLISWPSNKNSTHKNHFLRCIVDLSIKIVVQPRIEPPMFKNQAFCELCNKIITPYPRPTKTCASFFPTNIFRTCVRTPFKLFK